MFSQFLENVNFHADVCLVVRNTPIQMLMKIGYDMEDGEGCWKCGGHDGGKVVVFFHVDVAPRPMQPNAVAPWRPSPPTAFIWVAELPRTPVVRQTDVEDHKVGNEINILFSSCHV